MSQLENALESFVEDVVERKINDFVDESVFGDLIEEKVRDIVDLESIAESAQEEIYDKFRAEVYDELLRDLKREFQTAKFARKLIEELIKESK